MVLPPPPKSGDLGRPGVQTDPKVLMRLGWQASTLLILVVRPLQDPPKLVAEAEFFEETLVETRRR